MRTYVITGATGHTGKPIAKGLLEQGHTVRIISRNAEKARELTDLGAILFEGDQKDVALLKKAFQGADAVFSMIPFEADASDYTAMQVGHATAMAEAIKATGIQYAVTLSSMGAHLPEGAGVVQGLEKMEKLFNALPELNVRHLRASYFMENTLGQVGTIKFMGVMASPVRADLKIPMVATRDIAAVGLRRLSELDFAGSSFENILGQRDITYTEVASILGKAIGRPDLAYVAVTYEDGKNAMVGMGMGASVVDRLMEFVKAMNDGLALADALRTPENTTPTSIEDFALVFKAVFEG